MKTLLCALILCAGSALSPAALLLKDDFSYSDGALTNVSAGRWRHASGGTDQVNIRSGQVELTRSETEDVESPLATSFAAASDGIIYFRFSLLVLSPPAGANGNYFAHLDGGSARARAFVTTNDAAAGRFRLGIAAGSNIASRTWPMDLNTNQSYTVVGRLVVSNAQASLWLDPVSSSDPSIDATDAASPASINRFAWRQDAGMGSLLIDDLVVATTFDEAMLGNGTPSISDIPDQQLATGGTATVPFAIGDAEEPAAGLQLNSVVVPDDAVSVAFAGSGSNRVVLLSGLSGGANVANVTIFVSDGTTTNADSFVVTIVPALLFSEEFNYADGALMTNGTPPWAHHSGSITGQVEVLGGRMILSSTLTEDVNFLLPGGPFGTNSGLQFYAGMLMNFLQLPGASGDYFAHFNTTAGRCRLFASTANAAPGRYRLGIANGANTPSAQHGADLATNTSYRVVMRYLPSTAASTVWIEPAAETDAGADAGDAASLSSVGAFAFRQDPGIGRVAIDDVKVGLTFASVAGRETPRLRVERFTETVRVTWPISATGFVLQFTPVLGNSNWQDVATSPITLGEENVFTNGLVDHGFFRLRKP